MPEPPGGLFFLVNYTLAAPFLLIAIIVDDIGSLPNQFNRDYKVMGLCRPYDYILLAVVALLWCY